MTESSHNTCRLDETLEILGQQPSMYGLYTQICFCFHMPSSASSTQAIATLRAGLERMALTFPWISGQVVRECVELVDQPIYKIKSYEHSPILAVNDLRGDVSSLTWDVLQRARFPMQMLDEAIVAPYTTLPGGPGKSSEDPLPVLVAQITLVNAGLLLTFVGQHNTMDMTGQAQLISLIDKACREEQFTDEEVEAGNLARRGIIPLLDDSWAPEAEHTSATGTAATQTADLPQVVSQWACFAFKAKSLAELKAIASVNLTVDYVSTDDALTAFIWQQVSQVRASRLKSSDAITLARAVNVRKFLGIHEFYPGFIQNMTYHSYDLTSLVNAPLGTLASNLRESLRLESSNLAYETRAFATLLHRSDDKNSISFIGSLNTSKDLMLSSWAQVNSYSLDFGLGLGKPQSVRRPSFPPVEGLIYLLPKSLEGEIVVAMCLSNHDMVKLRASNTFARYAKYVG